MKKAGKEFEGKNFHTLERRAPHNEKKDRCMEGEVVPCLRKKKIHLLLLIKGIKP